MYFIASDLRGFRSNLKGFRRYSKDFTSDFKDSRDFMSGIKIFRLDFRYFGFISRKTEIGEMAGLLGISGILGQISGHLYTGFQVYWVSRRSYSQS